MVGGLGVWAGGGGSEGLNAAIYGVEGTSGTRVRRKVGTDSWISMVRIARPTISRLS